MIWNISVVLESFGGSARTFYGNENYFNTLRIDVFLKYIGGKILLYINIIYSPFVKLGIDFFNILRPMFVLVFGS